jgi:NADPH2:quinone reductase
MDEDAGNAALPLRSLVMGTGEPALSLVAVAMPVPRPDEVLVGIEASPINPSDQGLLFGAQHRRAADESQSRRHTGG